MTTMTTRFDVLRKLRRGRGMPKRNKNEWARERKDCGLEWNVDLDRTRSKDSNGRGYKTLVDSHETTTVTNLKHKGGRVNGWVC